MQRRSGLPFNLLLFCFEAFLVLSAVHSEAKKQQCRIQPPRQGNAQIILQPPPTTTTSTSTSISRTSITNHGSPTSIVTTSARSSTATSTSTSLPTLAPFDYANDKIRGVNLGGWLVLEPWITPSVFESTGNDNVVDEYTLGQLVDKQTALSILTNHWETWITEDDFAQISAAGLNHVRIPIGYWSIPLTSSDTSTSTSVAPYVAGAWPYLLRALGWAQKHNVYVILDLHGAPGSQNGYDNSGQRTNNPVWAVNPNNVTRTIDTLAFLAKEVGNQISVLELLNEGAGFISDAWASAIRSFFTNAYGTVRNVAGQNLRIMIGDAFLGVNSWTNFLTGSQGHGVMMDFHEYQIFSDDQLDRSFDDHINFACTYKQSLTSFASSNLWTVLGEWSNAATDCAKWLNGRGVGARWDGTWFPSSSSVVHGTCSNYTGSYTSWTADYKTFLRKYWEVQIDVGESVQGWVFWTWKAENADEWSYQKGLQGGWIPKDPTDRMYPGICS